MAFLDALALRLGRRLPLVLQTEATECGLACLAMIAGYHGHHTGLMELRRRFSVSLKGISLKQLIQTAHRLGLGTRAVKLDLGDLGKLKLPCVLHWNFNHFVVLKAVDGRGAVLHDPAHGQRRLGLEEVSRSFTGVALELWPESGFEKQEAPPRIKLLGMLGKVTGLYRSLAQVLLLAGALEVFSLISPFFLQWTIDNVIVSEDRDLLSTLAIGFGLLLLMQQAVSGVRAWVMMHMSTLLGVQWQANVFSHLLRLPAQYFEKRHLGDVVSRFGAVNSIQQTLTAAFLSAVLDGLMTVATLGMMLLYSPPLAAIAIAAMSLYALGRWIWYRPLRNATEEQIVHAARQQSHFLETVRGIRPLKLFQRQDERRSVWLGLLVEQINAGLRTQKLQLFYQQLNGLLFGVENLLVIWLGATMVMDGQFSVGILMAFNAYKSQFDSRVGSLIDKFFELRMLQLQGERLADIVLQAPEVSHGDILPENLREREASIEIQACATATRNRSPGSSTASTCASPAVSRWPSSAPRAAARAPCSTSCWASSRQWRDRSAWPAWTLRNWAWTACANWSARCCRTTCCSPVRSATTSVSSTRSRTCPGCCSARRWLPSTMTSRPCRWATTPWSATWARCSPAARSSG